MHRFLRASRGYWKDPINQKNFLKEIETELKITKPEDWYSITVNQFCKLGGRGLLAYRTILYRNVT
jgi:hypothetical protein